MSILKSLKKRILDGFKNNLSLAICSVVIAIIAWLVISMTIYPSIPKTILDVPLDIDISGTAAAENGLSLISCNVESVDVKILGNRTEVGNLSSENLKARIVADNISTTGTKELKIEVVSNDPNVLIEVESITPSEATVVFDIYETIAIPVEPAIPNITFAEGKTKDESEFRCDPEVINITGPAAQLRQIKKCTAVSRKSAALDTSYTLANDEIVLYTEDGTIIEQSPFKFDTTSFQIYVPVLTQKTVGLTLGISKAPSSFDKDSISFDYSVNSLTIASKTSKLEDIPDTIEIGKVLLSDLKPGFTQTYPIDLADYINLSNVDTVTVTLNDEGLASKTLYIDNFEISNAPSNYDFEVITQRTEITVVGPADIIESITSKDIIADVNLSNATADTIQGESFNHDVNYSCPNYDNVWVATQSNVILTKTEKTTEEETTENYPDNMY